MYTWRQLVHFLEEELGKIDLAIINLACAADLPDAENVDFDLCLRSLDLWVKFVREYTNRLLPQFRRNPQQYKNSEAYFRALCLVSHLQRDLGLRYNPAKVSLDVPLDTADTFIHGAIVGAGGTCASLPVIYVAVARRLGYPVKLASAVGDGIGHLFARWEEPGGERFNIEATNQGLHCPPDDYYRTGRYAATTPSAEQHGGYLKSQTPKEELAGFLVQRAFRWLDYKSHRRAVESLAWAAALAPQYPTHRDTLRAVTIEWDDEQNRRKPPRFPDVRVRIPQRRFPPTLPLRLEADFLCLAATEHILDDAENEFNWWQPMRAGLYSQGMPVKATAEFGDGTCKVKYAFNHDPEEHHV